MDYDDIKQTISICIATYNGEKYLTEQLDSLANQTIQPYEVILQDDCSSDNTVKIAKTYQDRLNLKIFVNEINLGFTKNFESVLSKATGDFIAPCDQDDIWESDKLELLLTNIGNSSLIYSNSLLVDQDGQSLNMTLSEKLGNQFINSDSALNFLYANCISAHAMLFRKDLLKYIFPFPQYSYFDAWIGAIAASAHGVKYINKNLVLYRQHNTNVLANKKKTKQSLLEKVILKKEKKMISNKNMISLVEEFLRISVLSKKEQELLENLSQQLEEFEVRWFNFRFFFFFVKYKDVFFPITTKNKLVLSIKKSIGYKLYKVAPFL